MKWEEDLKILLSNARYAFPEGRPNETEYGEFTESIRSFCSDQRKKMFFLGYKTGGSDVYKDMSEAYMNGAYCVPDFDSQIAEQGAWKRWAEVNK